MIKTLLYLKYLPSIEVFVESENQQAEGAPLLLGNLTENHYLSLEPIENIFKGICSFTF